jgi:hypothetical protein
VKSAKSTSMSAVMRMRCVPRHSRRRSPPLPTPWPSLRMGPVLKHEGRLKRGRSFSTRPLVPFQTDVTRCSLGPSLTALKNQISSDVSAAQLSERAGTDIKIVQVDHLHNGGLIIEFSAAEAAAWLRTSGRPGLLDAISYHVEIKDRQHNAMVTFVPLAFNPEEPTDLRGVEEVTGLPTENSGSRSVDQTEG